MPICGPKLSAFCMIMSAWGVVFLGFLGVFFYMEAVTLFPDIVVEFQKNDTLTRTNFVEFVSEKYSEKAVQCWIAAGMYLVTLIIVFWQNRLNTTQIF